MSIWKYKHDRSGDTSALSVSVTVDGRHGVIGLNGIAPPSGFPDAAINSTGDLKAFDGTAYSDFISGAARPGIDPDPDTYRLTVRKGGLPISSITFQPILSSPTATELDINALVKAGKALSATPEQLIALGEGLADLDTKKTRADADHAAVTQSLADSAQAAALATAAAGLTTWGGGDHTTLPSMAGAYRIMTGDEIGQVWVRTEGETLSARRRELEALTTLTLRTRTGSISPFDAPLELTSDYDTIQWAAQNAYDTGLVFLLPSKPDGSKWDIGQNHLWVQGDTLKSFSAILQAEIVGSLSNDDERKHVFYVTNAHTVTISGGVVRYAGSFDPGPFTYSGTQSCLVIERAGRVMLSGVSATGGSKDGINLIDVLSYDVIGCSGYENRVSGLKYSRTRGGTTSGGDYHLNGKAGDESTGYGVVFPSVVNPGDENEQALVIGVRANNNIRKGIDAHSIAGVSVIGCQCNGNGLWGIYTIASAIGLRGHTMIIANNSVNGCSSLNFTTTAAAGIQVGAVAGAVADHLIVSNNIIKNVIGYGIYVLSGNLRTVRLDGNIVDGVRGLGIGCFVSSDGLPKIYQHGNEWRNIRIGSLISKAVLLNQQSNYYFSPSRRWTALMNINVLDTIRPSVNNGFIYRASSMVVATTAASEPIWPTALGNTVDDGTATWQAVALTSASNWLPSTRYAVGTVVLPTVGTGFAYQQAAPRAGVTEPTWPTGFSATVMDNGGLWQAVTLNGANPVWNPNTPYVLNAQVRPTGSSVYSYKRLSAGSSGATEPFWPVPYGQTVTDGGITWECCAQQGDTANQVGSALTGADHWIERADRYEPNAFATLRNIVTAPSRELNGNFLGTLAMDSPPETIRVAALAVPAGGTVTTTVDFFQASSRIDILASRGINLTGGRKAVPKLGGVNLLNQDNSIFEVTTSNVTRYTGTPPGRTSGGGNFTVDLVNPTGAAADLSVTLTVRVQEPQQRP